MPALRGKRGAELCACILRIVVTLETTAFFYSILHISFQSEGGWEILVLSSIIKNFLYLGIGKNLESIGTSAESA